MIGLQTILNPIAADLTSLGIEYRKGGNFWTNNCDQLHYLYHDLQTEGRQALARYHPDRGGDEESFKQLNLALIGARNCFLRRIGGREHTLARAKEQEAREERRAAAPKRNHKRNLPPWTKNKTSV